MVDLAFIDDLHGISRDDGVTTIGSMTEYARVADDEQLWGENRLVAESTAAIGDIQVETSGPSAETSLTPIPPLTSLQRLWPPT